MRHTPMYTPLVGLTVAAGFAGPAPAQTVPLHPDPIVIRLTSFSPVEQVIIPAIIEGQGLDKQSIGHRTLAEGDFYQLNALLKNTHVGDYKVWLGQTSAKGAKFGFEPGPTTFDLSAIQSGGTTKIRCNFSAEDAELDTKVRYRVREDEEDWWATVPVCSGHLEIDVTGVDADATVSLSASNGRLKVSSINDLDIEIGEMDLDDSSRLLGTFFTLADWGIKLLNIFGEGIDNTAELAADVVNDLLDGEYTGISIEDLVQAATKHSLPVFDVALDGTHPLENGNSLGYAAQLSKIEAAGDGLAVSWKVGVQAVEPTPGFDLPYASPTRPATTLAQLDSLGSGDLFVAIPLSLMDRAVYEAFRAGLADTQVEVPADPKVVASTLGIDPAKFTPDALAAHVTVRQLMPASPPDQVAAAVERLRRNAAFARELQGYAALGAGCSLRLTLLSSPVIKSTQVNLSRGLAGRSESNSPRLFAEARVHLWSPGVRLSQQVPWSKMRSDRDGVDAEATVRIFAELVADEDGGILLRLGDVELADVSGTVTLLGRSEQAASYANILARNGRRILQSHSRDIPLRGSIDLPGGIDMQLKSLSVGPSYAVTWFDCVE